MCLPLKIVFFKKNKTNCFNWNEMILFRIIFLIPRTISNLFLLALCFLLTVFLFTIICWAHCSSHFFTTMQIHLTYNSLFFVMYWSNNNIWILILVMFDFFLQSSLQPLLITHISPSFSLTTFVSFSSSYNSARFKTTHMHVHFSVIKV